MYKIKYIIISVFVLSLLSSCISRTKVAVVRSNYVKDHFLGQKEANSLMLQNLNKISKRLRSQKMELTRLEKQLKSNHDKDSLDLLSKKYSALYERYKQDSLQAFKYLSYQNGKIQQGVDNQIKSYISVYAELHGISMVLGYDTLNFVHYGDQIDISETILQGLNETY